MVSESLKLTFNWLIE